MPQPVLSEANFIAYLKAYGGAETARKTGMSERAVLRRRRRIEARLGITIDSPNAVLQERTASPTARRHFTVENGVVLVGSDTHYWPGIVSTAHAGFVKFCERFNPAAVVLDGDIVDGASLSRHPPIGWEYSPGFADEIQAAQDRLAEIEAAAPDAAKFWPAGNHDLRFESKIAKEMPELARVQGVHLKDHFPNWQPCWSVWINDNTVIKHRWKGGVHAGFNNAKDSGKHFINGHLHQGTVTPYTDYNGTRWGVSLPTMAEPNGPQFVYGEDAPSNSRSGFVVLTYIDGELCMPELALVIRTGVLEFRGERIQVG